MNEFLLDVFALAALVVAVVLIMSIFWTIIVWICDKPIGISIIKSFAQAFSISLAVGGIIWILAVIAAAVDFYVIGRDSNSDKVNVKYTVTQLSIDDDGEYHLTGFEVSGSPYTLSDADSGDVKVVYCNDSIPYIVRSLRVCKCGSDCSQDLSTPILYIPKTYKVNFIVD